MGQAIPASAVEDYGHYFLGSIIISDRDGHKFIIDGQQRLTTLTLLLIHIYVQLEDDEQKAQIADLIFSMRFGRRSFNLDVDERAACMEALFTGSPFEEAGQPESVVNILRRFRDVTELFPAELAESALPYFADWLIENVHLVEITAYSDADAYTIFETMNDRGLSLTPTDMLKGYLLANIGDAERRNRANQLWRTQVTRLQDLGRRRMRMRSRRGCEASTRQASGTGTEVRSHATSTASVPSFTAGSGKGRRAWALGRGLNSRASSKRTLPFTVSGMPACAKPRRP